MDVKEPFEVWTDHENLKYIREPHKLNGRQARWYLKLQDYDFTLKHILKKTNMKADILSRKDQVCYDLKLKGLSDKTTLVLSNTRELDRVPSTK